MSGAGRQRSVGCRIGGQLSAITGSRGGSGSSTGEQQIIDVAAAAVATEAG